MEIQMELNGIIYLVWKVKYPIIKVQVTLTISEDADEVLGRTIYFAIKFSEATAAASAELL